MICHIDNINRSFYCNLSFTDTDLSDVQISLRYLDSNDSYIYFCETLLLYSEYLVIPLRTYVLLIDLNNEKCCSFSYSDSSDDISEQIEESWDCDSLHAMVLAVILSKILRSRINRCHTLSMRFKDDIQA